MSRGRPGLHTNHRRLDGLALASAAGGGFRPNGMGGTGRPANGFARRVCPCPALSRMAHAERRRGPVVVELLLRGRAGGVGGEEAGQRGEKHDYGGGRETTRHAAFFFVALTLWRSWPWWPGGPSICFLYGLHFFFLSRPVGGGLGGLLCDPIPTYTQSCKCPNGPCGARALWQRFSKCFSTGFYRSPVKHLIKNGFQYEAMEKPFCNLYYGGEAKNSGFPRLLPHM
jgi:hypothetical protein